MRDQTRKNIEKRGRNYFREVDSSLFRTLFQFLVIRDVEIDPLFELPNLVDQSELSFCRSFSEVPALKKRSKALISRMLPAHITDSERDWVYSMITAQCLIRQANDATVGPFERMGAAMALSTILNSLAVDWRTDIKESSNQIFEALIKYALSLGDQPTTHIAADLMMPEKFELYQKRIFGMVFAQPCLENRTTEKLIYYIQGQKQSRSYKRLLNQIGEIRSSVQTPLPFPENGVTDRMMENLASYIQGNKRLLNHLIEIRSNLHSQK